MANISRLKIITELGELVYKQTSDLNLTFNRIVDDYTDIGNRFGDFSYDFNLPIVKQNSKIFDAPETGGSKGYFVKNRNIACQVYNNSQLLLDGVINLESVTKDTYLCKFYSKFKELIDSLNEKNDEGNDKTLKDLNLPVIENWNYETALINHLEANYADSDGTDYQYPLSFYSTMYCQFSYYDGVTDDLGLTFRDYADRQNYYFTLNSVGANNNRVYHHQVPPAIYIVSIMKQIMTDAGWTLGGQFFEDQNIKKIIYLYSGEDDIYDQATGIESGNPTLSLQLAKFLPEMAQSEFLQGIINYFNLYFTIDTNNKIIKFETYDTLFRATDGVDPYDITHLVDNNSGNNGFSYFSNNNPSLVFANAENRNVFGDNEVMTGSTDNATTQTWAKVSTKTYNQTFNRIGYSQTSKTNKFGSEESTIDLPFSEPTIKKHWMYNDYDINGVSRSATRQRIYLPLLSIQSKVENDGMEFNKNDSESYLYNNESSIKFKGQGSLMYYYGPSTTDFENRGGVGQLSNFLYYNMYAYTGATLNRLPIPIVSPFQALNYRDAIESWLNGITIDNVQDRRTTTASYLQSVWHMLGSSTNIPDNQLTDYSLVFDDGGYFHETLWSKFHKYKWTRYQQSEMFTGDMIMNSYDWQELQINRPILYNDELYSLVSIEGYNPITQRAQIKIIKKL